MRGLRAAGLSLLVVLIAMAEIAWGQGTHLTRPTVAQLGLVLIGAAALVFRHRHPRTVAIVTLLCGFVLPMLAPHSVLVDAATIVALYTVAESTGRRPAATLGAIAAALLTASSIRWLPAHFHDIRIVLPINYIAAAIAVGDSIRTQRALLRQERQRAREAEETRTQEANLRVRAERVRIARELHNVVAHHITLVNAQAGVAHHLIRTDPDRAYQALAGIKEASRAALDDLRATVGLLRADDEPETRQPAPTFAELPALLASIRAAGHDVQITEQGTPRPLTGPADLAAYRIVQEALTNAGKHGTGSPATLTVTYGAQTLELTVTNPAAPGHRGPGTGHGMIGMRERAESAGGHFTFDRDHGLFTVRARLPLLAPNSTLSP